MQNEKRVHKPDSYFVCKAMVCFNHKYCHNCAQALDWTDVEKYREKIFQQLKETYDTEIKEA